MKKGIKAGIGIAIVAAIFGGGYWGVTSYIDSQSPRKVVKGTSGTAIHIEEVSFYEGLNKIYGKAYMPQDTLGRKPVVIYCHGLGQNGDESDALCRLAAGKGYVAYTFDFRSGGPASRSTELPGGMSVETERKDLETVVQRIRKEDFTDKGKVFLMGHSQGGLVAALVGSSFRREVAGMILIAPAFNLPDMGRERYPKVKDIADSTNFIAMVVGKRYFSDIRNLNPYKWLSRYDGDVLLIQGAADDIVPQSYADRAAEEFKNVDYKLLPGIGHTFNSSSARKQLPSLVGAYLDAHLDPSARK